MNKHLSPFLDKYVRYNACVLLLIAILISANCHPAVAGNNNRAKRVLLLNSYHKGYSWTDEITRGIEVAFKNQKVDLHIEYLDTKRQFSPAYKELLDKLLSWKHGRHQYDLVITSDNNAFDYFKERGRAIFGMIPHIFCGVNYLDRDMLKGTFNCTGVNEKANIQDNISLITELHPYAKKVIVITDNTPTGKRIQQEIKKVKKKYRDRIDIDLLFDTSIEELGQKLQTLDSETIVLYTFFFRDKAGTFLEFDESARFVTDHAAVPIYNAWSFAFGFGGVGGYLVDAYQQGNAAAKQAIEILNGKPVADIPILWDTPIKPRFDYRALSKYKLSVSQLPEESEVIYKPTSFYFKYKALILHVTIVFLFLSVALIVVVFALIRVKKSEREVLQEKEKFSKFFHNSPVWLIVSTVEEGVYLNVNTSFFKTTGFTKKEVIGKSSKDFGLWVNFDDQDKMIIALKDQGQFDAYPAQLKMKDGTIRNFLWSAVLIELNGETCSLNTLIDITEIEQARKEKDLLTQQLLHVQKMEAIGTLASGITHDFNNILSGIFGYTQLAISHVKDTDRTLKDLDHIIKAAQRATELTRQILTFSRKTEYKKQPIKVYLEVKEALKLLRSSIPTTIEIKQKLDSKQMVLLDPIKVHQVVMNLCTNAYHAMIDTGGALSVSLTDIELYKPKALNEKVMPPGEYVHLEVKDTGCGIDQEFLKKVFDPYYTTKNVGQGTGLGLSLVKAIVDEHEGFIDVCSKIGSGTIFSIYFPVVKMSPKNGNTIDKEQFDLTGHENIMVVDDEETIRNIYQANLEDHGYKVYLFENGNEALKAFEADPDKFDIVITDLTMPILSGDKLSKALLKIRSDLPIILCTGFSEMLSELEVTNIGISKVFQKPVVNKDILACLKQIGNH
jgi:two-component system, cell cycle sensor histidine kinase and response regulator CckA